MSAWAARPPLIGYGQRFEWSNGSVAVEGCESADVALWRASHMLYRSVPPRRLRRIMTPDQRRDLKRIARQKLSP